MPTTVRFNAGFEGAAIETFPAVPSASAAAQIVHNLFDRRIGPFDATTTPPVTVAHYSKIESEVGEFDFTALPTVLGPVNCSGKKLRFMRLENAAQAGIFTIQDPANVYPVPGLNFSALFAPGEIYQRWFADSAVVVDATHKAWEYVWQNGQPIYLTLLFG